MRVFEELSKTSLSFRINAVLLALATLGTCAFLLFLEDGKTENEGWGFGLFLSWTMFPYLAQFGVSWKMRQERRKSTILLICSFLIVGLAAFAFVDGFFIHTSSTSPLLVLFVPGWQLLGVVVVIAGFLGKSAKK